MNSGSFISGILNLTNWLGNGIMPLLAALMIALGIYKFSQGGDFERYFWGALGSLSVSGLLRLAEVFAKQGSGSTQLFQALLEGVAYDVGFYLGLAGSPVIVVSGWSRRR